MRRLKFLYLLAGILLLVGIVQAVDLDAVGDLVIQVGLMGLGAIILIYTVAFVFDAVTWQMTVLSVPLDVRWLWRFVSIRMAGEAFNYILPAAGLGGEPLKVLLLKEHYGVDVREGTASLILSRTVNMVGLMLFLAIGFVLVMWSTQMASLSKWVAAVGFVALSIGTGLFFLIQRYRVSSIAGTWLAGKPIGRRIDAVLHHVHDMDERLVTFYTNHGRRLFWAVILAFINWVFGVLEIWVAMHFFGHPISLVDAWIIEAMAQMVRTATFFIPLNLGAQEGTFVLMFLEMTGSSALGGAFAIIRRVREVIWALLGACLAAGYSLRRRRRGD